MALLIVNLDKVIGSAQAFRDAFKEQLPDLPIRFWPDAGEVKDIEYLAFMHPDFDQLPAFPNLKAMFSRSAGVESLRPASEAAEGPARQGGTAGRRSDDDGIRHHARPALPSRHAWPTRRPRRIGNGAGCRSSGPSKGALAFWASA